MRLAEPLNIATRSDIRQATLVPPGTWEVDVERSMVGFEVRHLKLAHVRGRFRVVAAAISSDGEGIASIAGSIDVASIDTGDPRRDTRLCAHDFFDVERHPTMFFKGVSLPTDARKGLAVRGTMTMRGSSRPLELRAEPSREVYDGGDGDQRIRARGIISRREFGLEWDSAFALGGLVIDDRVVIRLDVVLVRSS